MAAMNVLLTGWPSFVEGEATAGDVLSMDAVAAALEGARIPYEVAWSPRFRPGRLRLADAPPERYTHVVFACGPVHGEQFRWLHQRYARCRRIAVGVSVIDPDDPAVRGFDTVLARDGDGTARRDLAARAATSTVPVVGVIPVTGQAEYGGRRRHQDVADAVTGWLAGQDCARVPMGTRLGVDDWRECATADQFTSLLGRMDLVVTMRLHGLVLALRSGVPAVAVDPVAGGAKVSAQADAWSWPAVVTAEALTEPDGDGPAQLRRWYDWCRGPAGRAAARRRQTAGSPAGQADDAPLLSGLLHTLDGG